MAGHHIFLLAGHHVASAPWIMLLGTRVIECPYITYRLLPTICCTRMSTRREQSSLPEVVDLILVAH